MKVRDGILVASGTIAGKGAVDWLEMPTFKLEHRLSAGNIDTGVPLTREGMALFENEIWFLPEDGASRLFRFNTRP